MTVRTVGVIVMITSPLLALGGCAITAGSGLSSHEARGELYAVLDQTEETVGGVWKNQDDPTARGCVIPLWIEGEMFPGLRIGSPPRDMTSTLETVEQAWSKWGYRVEQSRIGEVVELQGRNSVHELLVFRVSEDAMTLQGESECRPTGA
ncbi:MAG: transketolase central region [Rhodoglobus sp.]|nr:transketolase central region [Rhodoglobus sp.]